MNRLILIAITFCALAANAAGAFDQSSSAKREQAQKIVKLMGDKVEAIVCVEAKQPQYKLILKKGWNTEDRTGLLVEGDFAYGTNEIRQINVFDDVIIRFGEEGNYTLMIRGLAWELFGVDEETDSPELNTNSKASAVVMNEDGGTTDLTCTLRLK